MQYTKLSVSIPSELAAKARKQAGPGGVSKLVAESLEKSLRSKAMLEVMREWETEFGEITPEEDEWARKQLGL